MCQKNNLTSSLMGHNSSLTEKCQNAWNAPGNSYDPQRKGVTRPYFIKTYTTIRVWIEKYIVSTIGTVIEFFCHACKLKSSFKWKIFRKSLGLFTCKMCLQLFFWLYNFELDDFQSSQDRRCRFVENNSLVSFVKILDHGFESFSHSEIRSGNVWAIQDQG